MKLYTAISLAYRICGAIAGGLTPLIFVLSLSRRHASAQRLEMANA
jgi:hypothetical protein